MPCRSYFQLQSNTTDDVTKRYLAVWEMSQLFLAKFVLQKTHFGLLLEYSNNEILPSKV